MGDCTIHDFTDHHMCGDYVVRVHKTNPEVAMAMSMRDGARRVFYGEACVNEAHRWAMEKFWKEGVL